MLLYATEAAMAAMSSGPPSVLPRTEADTGWHAPCDIGQQNAAIAGRGAASHSPHPTWPPAVTRTTNASWLPSAAVVTSGMAT